MFCANSAHGIIQLDCSGLWLSLCASPVSCSFILLCGFVCFLLLLSPSQVMNIFTVMVCIDFFFPGTREKNTVYQRTVENENKCIHSSLVTGRPQTPGQKLTYEPKWLNPSRTGWNTHLNCCCCCCCWTWVGSASILKQFSRCLWKMKIKPAGNYWACTIRKRLCTKMQLEETLAREMVRKPCVNHVHWCSSFFPSEIFFIQKMKAYYTRNIEIHFNWYWGPCLWKYAKSLIH